MSTNKTKSKSKTKPAFDESILYQGEEAPEFEENYQAYCDHFQPRNPAERALVRAMSTAMWRSRAANLAESELLRRRMERHQTEDPEFTAALNPQERIYFAFSEELAQPGLAFIDRWRNRQLRIYDQAMRALRGMRRPVRPSRAA